MWRRQWHPTPVLLPGKSYGWRILEGCSPWGRWVLDTTERLHLHALEKEMATDSSVLAWRIPGTGEPGGLPSLGSHRVRHDWRDLAAAAAATARHILWSLYSSANFPPLLMCLFLFIYLWSQASGLCIHRGISTLAIGNKNCFSPECFSPE